MPHEHEGVVRVPETGRGSTRAAKENGKAKALRQDVSLSTSAQPRVVEEEHVERHCIRIGKKDASCRTPEVFPELEEALRAGVTRFKWPEMRRRSSQKAAWGKSTWSCKGA
jgi:hypothetical protein